MGYNIELLVFLVAMLLLTRDRESYIFYQHSVKCMRAVNVYSLLKMMRSCHGLPRQSACSLLCELCEY